MDGSGSGRLRRTAWTRFAGWMKRRPALSSVAVGVLVFGVVSAVGRLSGRAGCEPVAMSAPRAGEPAVVEAAEVPDAVDGAGVDGSGVDGVDGLGDPRSPRAILSRVWFDRYPDKSRDKVRLWIWLAGGIGLTEHGSVFDARFEFFEFERQADKVSMVFFQDRSKAETKFKVEACDDLPPFDLCLTLDASPRGPKKLYGFGHDEDLAEHVPWGPSFQRVARERAASVKR
jgi:hypothetical protein